jgi:CubicO group peptidase (beta-lactamase class C family)
MGYSRTWTGAFRIEPQLREEHVARFEACVDRAPVDPLRSRCGWVPSPGEVFVATDTTSVQTQGRGWLEWDGAEKFSSGAEWLEYLLDAFFQPLGYTVTGRVTWEGEEPEDRGELSVREGVVASTAQEAGAFKLSEGELARWLGALKAPVEATRLEAMQVLASEPPSEGLVAAVAGVLLNDSSARMRLVAAEGLRAMGPIAKSAEAALLVALGDSADFVGAAAAETLGAVSGGPVVIAALEAAAASPSWSLRFRAEEAVERLKSK